MKDDLYAAYFSKSVPKTYPIRRMTSSSFSFPQNYMKLPVILKLTFVADAPYMAISPDLFPRAANPAEK